MIHVKAQDNTLTQLRIRQKSVNLPLTVIVHKQGFLALDVHASSAILSPPRGPSSSSKNQIC